MALLKVEMDKVYSSPLKSELPNICVTDYFTKLSRYKCAHFLQLSTFALFWKKLLL